MKKGLAHFTKNPHETQIWQNLRAQIWPNFAYQTVCFAVAKTIFFLKTCVLWARFPVRRDIHVSVCTYMILYVSTCIYMCAHVTWVCRYVCMYVCMYVCVYVCMSVCLSVCMYVCMYVWLYVCMYVCIEKFTAAFPCWMQCWTRAAVLFLSLLSLGTVVLSHLSQTLSNVWMLVYRYVGLLYTYLDINTASWHVDNCCLHVITNKMLNANCCKRITTLLVKRTLIG